jgi:prophage DNA circulation protein
MAGSRFDDLRDASFRGAPFEVETREYAGGRRLVRHEYPLRDTPFAEDLGRKAGEYPVEAFLVQGRKYDYASARDRLRKALDDAGPGTLIHPSLGELTVAVDGYRLKESSREGGYCTFSISFVEAGQAENPGAARNTAADGTARAGAARNAGRASFLGRYFPLPRHFDQNLAAFAGGVETACACLGIGMAVIRTGVDLAQSLLLEPERLADALAALFVPDTLAGARHYDFSPAAPLWREGYDDAGLYPPSGPALAAEIATQALVSAAEAAMLTDYATADDALASRGAILGGIDAASDYAPDGLFGALADLRLAVAVDLTTRGAQLPRVGYARLTATQPALVAAYQIYGDAARDEELVTRNRVRHPGRVPGGVLLEVLR